MDNNNNLVDDCLKIIFNKLETRENQDAFGLTCKHWFRIRNTTRKSLSFGEGLKSKNSKELSNYLPKIIARYSILNSVYLYNCPEITNSTLSKSKIFGSNLKSLTLSGCKKVSDKYLAKSFINCSNLVTLNLDGSNITNYVLKSIAKSCNTLRNINISNCPHISDHGLTNLFKGCPSINALNISSCKGIRGLGFKDCPNLTYLIADSCWFSLEGILHVFGVNRLEYLSLSDLKNKHILQEDISLTIKAEKLKFLNLTDSNYLSDHSFVSILQGSPLLEELNISKCWGALWYILGPNCNNLRGLNAIGYRAIFDIDLMDIIECKRLEIIYICNCSDINENGLEEFKVLRPEVAVVRDIECLSFGPCISDLFI